jgi:hypothetical protein
MFRKCQPPSLGSTTHKIKASQQVLAGRYGRPFFVVFSVRLVKSERYSIGAAAPLAQRKNPFLLLPKKKQSLDLSASRAAIVNGMV